MHWLLVCQSLVSHFYVGIDFREKEFNWKASCKTIRKLWFCNPSKTYQSLIEKMFSPMSFDEKIMGGNKIENLPIISEATLRLYVSIYYESRHRKYPPKSLLNDDGTSPEHICFGCTWTIIVGGFEGVYGTRNTPMLWQWWIATTSECFEGHTHPQHPQKLYLLARGGVTYPFDASAQGARHHVWL